MVGIYKITNSVNGDCYIGQSRDIERRWMEHITPKNIARVEPLKNAIREYGVDAFIFEVVELCDVKELDARERHYISVLKPAYNRNEGGRGNKGYIPSRKTKDLLSEYGRKQWERMSDEDKTRIITNNLTGHRKPYHMSEETKAKLRKASLGKRESAETRKKISVALSKAMKGNANRTVPVIAIDLQTMKAYFFTQVRFASFFIGCDYTQLIRRIKAGKPCKGFYCCSVETMGDECSPVGEEMRTSPKCAAPLRGEEIVHPHAMGKCEISDKGFIQLAMRSGQFSSINSDLVYEGEISRRDKLSGDIELNGERKSDKVVGYFAYFRLVNGFSKTLYMTVDEVKKHANRFSQTAKRGYGLWADAESFDAMAKKTVLKMLLSKYAPLSVDMQTAIKADQAIYHDERMIEDYADSRDDEKDEMAQKIMEKAEAARARVAKAMKEEAPVAEEVADDLPFDDKEE